MGTTQRLIDDSIQELKALDLPGLVERKIIRLKNQMEACVLAKSIFLSFVTKFEEMTGELSELLKTHVLQFKWRKKLQKALQDMEMTPEMVNPMQQELVKPGSLDQSFLQQVAPTVEEEEDIP